MICIFAPPTSLGESPFAAILAIIVIEIEVRRLTGLDDRTLLDAVIRLIDSQIS